MSTPSHAFIMSRANILAQVALTRREDIRVYDLKSDEEIGLNLMARIDREGMTDVREIGIILQGTAQPLATEAAAAEHLGKSFPTENYKSYHMPVLILLFSMEDDAGYYSWHIEPRIGSHDQVSLHIIREHITKHLDKKALNKIVDLVDQWYEIFNSLFVKVD